MTTIFLMLLLLSPTNGTADSVTSAAGVNVTTADVVERAEAPSAEGTEDSSFRSVVSLTKNQSGDSVDNAGIANSAIPGIQAQPVPTTASLTPWVDLRSYISDLPNYSSGMFIVAVTPSKPEVPHRFFDRANVIGISVHAAFRAADAAQTCLMLGRGVREAWLPMKGCTGIAAYSMSMIPAQIASSYMLHRTGHHRLERLSPYLWAAPSAAGIAVSMRVW